MLLPKKDAATSPSDYRPISLQNCPVKILTKILTTRLQAQIQSLVDIDQTGFIRGRSISENFVYATELVQCCHRRKQPTLVLKLDFAKAFVSVNWGNLHQILRSRGFPPCGSLGWIKYWRPHGRLYSSMAVLAPGYPANAVSDKVMHCPPTSSS